VKGEEREREREIKNMISTMHPEMIQTERTVLKDEQLQERGGGAHLVLAVQGC